MRRFYALILTILFLLPMTVLSACNQKTQIDGREINPSESAPNSGAEASHSETVQIDVDLTVLSSTMVYAEVYNIMTHPDDYVGQTYYCLAVDSIMIMPEFD